MLPLLAESTPTTIPAFTAALTRGLAERGIAACQIDAQGATFPTIEKLHIDLSGAPLTRDLRPPEVAGGDGPEVTIAHFELIGAPVYFEKAPLEIRLLAEAVKSRVAMSGTQGLLILEGAAAGSVSVEATRESLETLLHSVAVEAAGKQGLEVKKTSLTFAQEGQRSVSFRTEVTAKVFVMSATLALTGRVSIDDELNVQVSNLLLDGDGMILKLVGSYAKPYLDRLEGRVFPLLSFSAGGLKLRNIELTAGSALRIFAEFGAA